MLQLTVGVYWSDPSVLWACVAAHIAVGVAPARGGDHGAAAGAQRHAGLPFPGTGTRAAAVRRE